MGRGERFSHRHNKKGNNVQTVWINIDGRRERLPRDVRRFPEGGI
ncbi:hypothetical protein HSB1_06090 [Halogranum salarium B-1]|uniref:Uncharacterized protein n=1 Tax=Halogranum salarium B-1 TaxID=1210908 RepID=J3A7H6_9EURY|nr:hypothetical protein HSB1_06090 [Halogranum salarium B-1]